jgi:membrane fusion protein, multidrug efflux system
MTTSRAVHLLLPAVALALTAACSGGNAESKQQPPQPARRPTVPVAVAAVERKEMPVQIQAIGTVEAYSVVSVRAQVGGELMRAHVKEGQDVKKGDLLFTIDPRTYEAALAQAQANLAKDQVQVQQARAVLQRDHARVAQARANLVRDQAQAANAKTQERRYSELVKQELVSKEQYDQVRTTAESFNATVRADEAEIASAEETVRADEAAIRSAEQTVKADEAAVESARLQLGYTTIRSPVTGRAGSLGMYEGNVVRASGTNDSTLLVINQVEPIYVSFTVPQQQLAEIKRYMAEATLAVDAVPTGETRPVRGAVTFVDNAVDVTTGTIRLKATFANNEKRLWPGQFANVSLTLAVQSDALVIPSQALQAGQQGAFVFVVKPDATVETRRVVTARAQGNETIIASGLEAGEQVVTDGLARLSTGAKVEVRAPGGRGGERPRDGGGPGRPDGVKPASGKDGAAARGAGAPPTPAGKDPAAKDVPAADTPRR